jgi:peptidoglycan hydrolase-like protein with peptidoglycan-binding domain
MAYSWMHVANCDTNWSWWGGNYGKDDTMPSKYMHPWGTAYTDAMGVTRPAPTEDVGQSWYHCYVSGHPSAIKLIQTRLNARRSAIISAGGNIANVPAPLTTDGVWGPKTRAMTEWVQGHSSLTVDGIVGEKTWNKIK